MNIVQVHAPTSDHSDDEVDSFYEQVDNVSGECKSGDVTPVMGDMNAKDGEGHSGNVVGNLGLGERNERRDRWVE